VPTLLGWFCEQYVAAAYKASSGDAADRFDGIYGKAFNPKKPNVRLTKEQRRKIMLKNMNMQGA
jgi:hypothetical protein